MRLLGRVSQEQIVFGPRCCYASASRWRCRNSSARHTKSCPQRLDPRHPRCGDGSRLIGRGIDLSLVALMAVSLAWTLHLIEIGMPLPLALAIGLAFTFLWRGQRMAGGLCRDAGDFRDLAIGTLIFTFRRYYLFDPDVVYMPIGRATCSGWGRERCLEFPFRSPLWWGLPRRLSFPALCQVRPLSARRGDNLLAAHNRRTDAAVVVRNICCRL